VFPQLHNLRALLDWAAPSSQKGYFALDRGAAAPNVSPGNCYSACDAPAGSRPDAAIMTARRNAMTVDVEDGFQAQAFAHCIARADWDSLPTRVDRNTNMILDQFAEAEVSATFFTLGWVAERFPGLIRRIVAEGHELASHGWDHTRADIQDEEVFRDDVSRTRLVLQAIGGVAVAGYRAPTFSIGPRNMWALRILRQEGYLYSSSVNPIRHDLYGMPDAPRAPFRPFADGVVEIPLTTVRLFGHNWPCSGGGYFRLLPRALYRAGLTRVNRHDRQPGIFYFHPWEIDPDQPRIANSGWKSHLRHHINLSRMTADVDLLLRHFAWDRMDRVYASVLTAGPADDLAPLVNAVTTDASAQHEPACGEPPHDAPLNPAAA
jgi:polysaccharide deacetylase family protein (PEP-CTERM system associated)